MAILTQINDLLNRLVPSATDISTDSSFMIEHHELRLNGKSIDEWYQQSGGAPFYAYSKALITERVHTLRQQFGTSVELHYAIKANPMPAVVQHMASLVDGFDVASAQEINLALSTGMNPHHIGFAGPGKRQEEILAAVQADIVIHVESVQQLLAVQQAAKQTTKFAKVVIRVNPNFTLKHSGMKMGGGAQPFGIDEEKLPEILAQFNWDSIDLLGLQFYAGSQNLHADAIIATQHAILEAAQRIAAFFPSPLRLLNIGGGFGIPYFVGESALETASIAEHFKQQWTNYASVLPQAKVILELGRYLVGEAGLYVCQVLERKVSRGEVFLITDGGMHHHLAASGNLGQTLRRHYPIGIANKIDLPAEETVHVTGCLCTPLDRLASNIALPKADVGDHIVIFQSGAYGRSASPLGFLSHPAPVEFLL